MFKWLRLSHHHHSGKLRPHDHTSYVPLGILLLFVGLALTAYTSYAAEHPGPQAGSVGLSGVMPAEPPTTAATIDEPLKGQRFSYSPIKVSGTCPDNTLVELFKNDIFAGSTPCSEAGSYSLDIDLLIGTNKLVAKVYDSLNQAGPDSNAVTVYYDALPVQSSPFTSPALLASSQLLLNTDAVYRGVFPNQNLNIAIDIISGTPPYAINIKWGDANNNVLSRNNNASFNTGHAYNKAGTYQIVIQASDAAGRVAFLTVAAIVNGQPSTGATATDSDSSSNNTALNRLLLLWPLYVSSAAVVVSFWLGERREKHVLSAHGLLINS